MQEFFELSDDASAEEHLGATDAEAVGRQLRIERKPRIVVVSKRKQEKMAVRKDFDQLDVP